MNLYIEHFGLDEPPFQITPTTDFFFRGGVRGEILDALAYSLNNNGGILAVTGEVGSGKTMICRTLMERLDDDIDIVYIANPSLTGREILYNIAEELGLEVDHDKPNMVRVLQNYLITQYAKGYKVIVFIDEAQAMPNESLEEIRLLSNLESNRDKLLQIVMFGQPEFTEKIMKREMRQLRERITSHFELQPFGERDVRAYIDSRLHKAGQKGRQPLFAQDACRLIWQVSEGILRRVNLLADKAMLAAFAKGDTRVTVRHVRIAVRDAGYRSVIRAAPRVRPAFKALAASAAALALLGAVWLHQSPGPGGQIGGQAVLVDPLAPGGAPAGDEGAPAADAGDGDGDLGEIYELAASATTLLDEVRASIGREAVTAPERTAPGVVEPLQSDGSAPAAAAADLPDFDSMLAAVRRPAAPATVDGDLSVLRNPGPLAAIDNPSWRWMPESSYLRRRLNATERLLTANPRDFYTVRLMTVTQERAIHVENFLRDFSTLYPARNVMVYPARIDARPRFVVTYGLFETEWAAAHFLERMPAFAKGSLPHTQALVVSQFESASAW